MVFMSSAHSVDGRVLGIMPLRLASILFVAFCCAWPGSSAIPGTPGSTHGNDALEIISPLPNERFVTNETVTLKVLLNHLHVDGSQVVWTDSNSGVLGHGPDIQVSKLLPGTHTISVSIAGETQSVSIREFENLLDFYQAP